MTDSKNVQLSLIVIFIRIKVQHKKIKNNVDVLHVRLTELHAAHQNLPCYLLTYQQQWSPLFPTVLTLRGSENTPSSGKMFLQ